MSRQEEWNLERFSTTASTWNYNSYIEHQNYVLNNLNRIEEQIKMRGGDIPTPFPIDKIDVTVDIEEELEKEPEKEFLFDPKELDV